MRAQCTKKIEMRITGKTHRPTRARRLTLVGLATAVATCGLVVGSPASGATATGAPAGPAAASPPWGRPVLSTRDLGRAEDFGGTDGRRINDLGLVAGWGFAGPFSGTGFIWWGGQRSDLPNFQPHAVNNHGHVVGSMLVSRLRQAARWADGTLTTLGYLGEPEDAGGLPPESHAADVNARGEIVGTSTTDSGSRHAFVWRDGVMTDLGTLGGEESAAFAINDLGHVVGTSETATGEHRAFVWRDGVMTDLGTLGGPGSFAHDINNAGMVIGWATTPSGVRHAALWQEGEVIDLQPHEPAREGRPVSMNERGQILVNIHDESNVEKDSYIWHLGWRIPLGDLGGAFTAIRGSAINERGQVAGIGTRADGTQRAFLWSDGVMTDLGTLGGPSSVAYDLNSAGQVVGGADAADGRHAVIWRLAPL